MTIHDPLAALDAAAPLIPLADFFTNPDHAQPRLSPDASYLAWLAPAVDSGAKNLQVFAQPLAHFRQGTAKGRVQVTHRAAHDVPFFQWALDSETILWLQDADGDEDFHLYARSVRGDSGNTRDLTPFKGVTLGLGAVNNGWFVESKQRPGTAVIALNMLDKARHDVYELDLATGALALALEVPAACDGVHVDGDLRVRALNLAEKDGSTSVQLRDVGSGALRTVLTSTPLDTLAVVQWTREGTLVLATSVDRGAVALVAYDPATEAHTVVAEGDVDVVGVQTHAWTEAIQLASFDTGRTEWRVLDAAVAADWAAVEAYAKQQDADVAFVASTMRTDNLWMLRLTYADKPAAFVLFHRGSGEFEFLFTSSTKLASLPLGRMASFNYSARDGLPLQAYATFPPGYEATRTYPMVLLVHGGPWSRVTFGYAATPQWLANRGYVVVQPNFRGSTGFNKKLLISSFKQWGKAMHTDLLDTVEYAVAQGWADRKHVAIFGGSYGGYAALAGVTLTPDFFTCAVDIVGPSSLKTLLATIPPYWASSLAMFISRMGDPIKDSDLLDSVSPVNHAHKIVRPLLIAQGKNDPRVKEAESEQIVSAIAKNGGDVYYALYPDEGHGFHRPANRIDFFGKAELFLRTFMGPKVRCQEGLSLEVNSEGASAVVRVVGSPLA